MQLTVPHRKLLTRRFLLRAALAAPAIIATRSLDAAFFQAAVTKPSSAPAPAAAQGLNTLAWSWLPNSGLTDINTANQSTTKPASLNWNWTSKDPFAHPYDNSLGLSYDAGKTALVISSSASNQFANGLSTVWLDNPTPTVWQGRALDMTKAWFLEIVVSFDQSLSPAGSGFTPCPAATVYSFVGSAAASEYTEKDIFEFQRAGAGAVAFYQNTFESNVSGGNYQSTNGLLDNTSYGPPTFTATLFETYGHLYLPTTANAGTGIYRPYFNNNTVTANSGGTATLSFTLAGMAQPGSVGPAGAFSYPQVHSQLATLIINGGIQQGNTPPFIGGSGWPIYMQAVRVWGADASVVVTQT